MPYRSNRELPDSVRVALPTAAQDVFREIVNSALEQYDGDERRAFATAWAGLRNAGWEKNPAGEWVEKAESFKPPEDVQAEARRGLELREKWGRGGLTTQEAGEQGIGSGVARARDLAAGKGVSGQTIRRMVSFFARHEQNKDNKDEDGGPSAGAIAYLLWGGEPGKRWARKVIERLKKSHQVFPFSFETKTARGEDEEADFVYLITSIDDQLGPHFVGFLFKYDCALITNLVQHVPKPPHR